MMADRSLFCAEGELSAIMKMSKATGYTLTELMITVAIIAIVLAIVVPNVVRARSMSVANLCFANLDSIETAKRTWALDKGKNDATPVTMDMLIPIYLRDEPKCPFGGTYSISAGEAVGFRTRCSIHGYEPPWTADIDRDGDVDFTDFSILGNNYTGAGVPQDPEMPGYDPFADIDCDGDVDEDDFQILVDQYTG